MKHHLSLAIAALLAAGATQGFAEEKGGEGLSNISYKLNLRPRVETVTQDNTADDATAGTLKTLAGIGYQQDGFGAYAEVVNVSAFTDTYKDLNGNGNEYSVVADPAQSRVTQANVSYRMGGTTFVAGRKMLNIDEQRFVGAVGWRQMPQTFDLVAAIDNSYAPLTVTAGYVTRVNTIFADADTSLKPRPFDTASLVLHAAYKLNDATTLSAYHYALASISDTTGLKLKGSVPSGDMKLLYKVEYAMQKDASQEHEDAYGYFSGKPKHDSAYTAACIGVKTGDLTAKLAYEKLGHDSTNGGAFATPLATLHKFNGWADNFLSTPANGLVDTALVAAYKSKDIGALTAVYHAFSTDKGGDDLGTELDLSYAKGVMKDLKILLKGALYTAGDDTYSYVDTTKYWLMAEYTFKSN